jgi:hypothetical protein
MASLARASPLYLCTRSVELPVLLTLPTVTLALKTKVPAFFGLKEKTAQ